MPAWSGGYAAAQARHREKKRALINDAKRVPCQDCGGTFPTCAMDFDHRDPGTKLIGIGAATHSLQKIKDEIAKCDVVCANCHRVRTHKCRV